MMIRAEELFIQLPGDVTLKFMDPVSRERSEVVMSEGEMYLPSVNVRHSQSSLGGLVFQL